MLHSDGNLPVVSVQCIGADPYPPCQPAPGIDARTAFNQLPVSRHPGIPGSRQIIQSDRVTAGRFHAQFLAQFEVGGHSDQPFFAT